MKKYHIVAFDLDGTLTNPYSGLTRAFEYGLRKAGVKCGPRSELKKFIGPPLRDSFMQEYGLSVEKAEEAVYLFREYFGVYGWWDNELYAGITELLSALKRAGFKIVLATSKPDVYSSKILRRFGLSEFFDFAEGASFDHKREKKSEVLDYALSKVGVISEEERRGAVLIGDTVYDVEGANELGVDSIAVTYGFGKREDLEALGATYVVDTVSELYELLGVEK